VSLIEVRGLTKLYRMGDSVVRALDGVDLTIERADFVAITGASGSGKSTIMHLLGCLDRPTAGSYLLGDRDVSRLSDRQLAATRNQQIGFVFQTFNLINRTTALENVAVPLFYARKTNTRNAARRALERVGLAERSHHNPNELSGGERQRVAIARAIVSDPPLLLADEPTGNLDSRTGEQIMEIFRKLNEQGVTIVMVTHEPDIAQRARRIVQMRDGKIMKDGPSAEFFAEHPVAAPMARAVSEITPVEGGEQPQASAPPPEQPRRLPGARASLVCGLLGLALLAVAVAVILAMKAHFDMEAMSKLDPAKQQVPAPFVAGGLAAFLSLVAAIILGIVAIVLGRGARRRMRREVGPWFGRGKAIGGSVLGWLTIGLPIAWISISILKSMG